MSQAWKSGRRGGRGKWSGSEADDGEDMRSSKELRPRGMSVRSVGTESSARVSVILST